MEGLSSFYIDICLFDNMKIASIAIIVSYLISVYTILRAAMCYLPF